MTAKRLLQIIDEELHDTEAIAENYAKRIWAVEAGKHDSMSLEALNYHFDIADHRISALGNLKIRINAEMREESRK